MNGIYLNTSGKLTAAPFSLFKGEGLGMRVSYQLTRSRIKLRYITLKMLTK